MPIRNYISALERTIKRAPLDAASMAQGMGTAPSEGAARFGSNFLPGIGDAAGLMQDAEMFYRDPSSRTPGNALLSAMGILPMIPGMAVFHGSPHKFEKFELSGKTIGTGDGGAYYGVGINVSKSKKRAAKFGENVYKAEIPESSFKDMIDYRKTLGEQPEILSKLRKAGVIGKEEWWADTPAEFFIDDFASSIEGSMALRDAGISGVKFPGWEKGDFVVFDESLLKMLPNE